MSEKSIPESFKMTELGSLPEEWDVVRLGDVVKKTEQKDPKKSPEWRFKYIDVSSITRENLQIVNYKSYQGNEAPSRAKKLVENKDVIFATVRPTLKRLTLIDEDFDGEICSTAFCVLRTREDILSQLFLLYAVQRDTFIEELGKIQRGASYPAVTDSDVKNQKIPLPPLPEQRAIAKVLSTVQGAKEKTETVIETTKELKKSLMKHLFTYGPVPVKKFNEFNELGVKELQNAQNSKNSSNSKNSINLKETEIGLVPEEWDVVRLGQVGQIVTGTTPRTTVPDYYGGPYMLIAPGDIGYSKYVVNAEKHLSDKGLKVSRLLPKETVLVVCIGATIGKVAMTFAEQNATNQQINAILPNETIFSHYLYYAIAFRSPYLLPLAGRAAVPIVNKSNFSNFKIPLPPIPIQQKIASFLSAVDEKIEVEQAKRKSIDELFKSLLQNLMTGKLRVTEL